MAENKRLSSRVLRTVPTNWRSFEFIQLDSLKELTPEARHKLKASMLENQFSEPFKVWEEPGTSRVYCLDGKHRTLILEELINEGYAIPYELPATFIECADKQQAAKLVLVYSSLYAKVTADGFQQFIDLNALDIDALAAIIDIPGLLPEFQEELLPLPDVLTDEGKDKPATAKLTFPSAQILEAAKADIELLIKKYEGTYFSVSCSEI